MHDVLIPLTSGLAIFLFGIMLMRSGLEQLAGPRIQEMISQFTLTPVRGFVTGTIATAILQSSSAVTVLAVSLTGAGMMSFTQSIGIILGTNVGTTITLEMLTLPLDRFALPLLVTGAGCLLLPLQKIREIGWICTGLGMLFVGLKMFQLVAEPIVSTPWFEQGVQMASQHLSISLLLGFLVTGIIQSSTAAIALVMALMGTGEITLAPGIAYVFGSNVGTCVTSLVASFGSQHEAKKVALAHLLLNVFGALALFPFIPWFAEEISRWSGSPDAQIAHTQVIFNIVCSLAVLPWARFFAHIVHQVYAKVQLLWP